MKYYILFLIAIINICCSVDTSRSNIVTSDTTLSEYNKSLEMNLLRGQTLKDSVNFKSMVVPLKVYNNDSILGLIDQSSGCLMSFDIASRSILNECLFTIYDGNLPLFKAYAIDSLYFLTYGYEDSFKTEIFDLDSSHRVFEDLMIEDVKNNKILLTQLEFLAPSPLVFIFDLSSNQLDTLSIRGIPFFNDELTAIFYSTVSAQGFTRFRIYDLMAKTSATIYETDQNLIPFSYNEEKGVVLCSSENKKNILEVDLDAQEVREIKRASGIYYPMYLDKKNVIVYLDDSKKNLIFLEYE